MTLRNLVETQILSEFGGWHMALREFRAAGIDPGRDCARLFFLDSHTDVVRAVLSGEADIGTVRTDTLERRAANGEIRMDAGPGHFRRCRARIAVHLPLPAQHLPLSRMAIFKAF
jgi:hypothetical protein